MGSDKKASFYKSGKRGGLVQAVILGSLFVAAILILGTVWTGRSASRDAEKARSLLKQIRKADQS